MGVLDLIGFGSGISSTTTSLPEIYKFGLDQLAFVNTDMRTIYSRILKDAFERADGISEDQRVLLSDNCLGSEKSDGLVTLLSKAMTAKSDLFLVYDKATQVIRPADSGEQSQIKKDYESGGKSSVGFYITFKNYEVTDLLRIYSILEYNTIASIDKSMKLSKAIQIKIHDMRASVALTDADVISKQAASVAEGLANGKDIAIDAKDDIASSNPDLTSAQVAINLIAQKRSFYLGLPASYINGILTGGMGDSGQADEKAIDRGLKDYYFSIVKPIMKSVFDVNTTFKKDDLSSFSEGIEALKVFTLVEEELMSLDDQKKIINRLFGIQAK